MSDRHRAQRDRPLVAAGPDGHASRLRRSRTVLLLEAEELTPPQLRAVETFIDLFADLPAIGLARHLLARGVWGPTEPVLAALADALASPHSSIDTVGASNVEHLASVLRGVLADAGAQARRPLTQDEVDRLVLETVLTDAFMKGRSPGDLERAATVPTNFGATGGAIFAGMKRHLAVAIAAETRMSGAVQAMVDGWLARGAVPATKPAVLLEAETAGLEPAAAEALVDVWKHHIMQPGRSIAAQGYLQGTWLHGIPSFAQVHRAVVAAKLPADLAPAIMETVLEHHMAGFVAAGFAKGGLRVDFGGLEAAGHIPLGAGALLANLYDAATGLADDWRRAIDHAAFHGQGLQLDQRVAYSADAHRLRDAIQALPGRGRSQLLNDDAMQFTDLGMPKWLAMARAFYENQGHITNGELLEAVYGKMVQPYLEENLARGSGDAFIAGTAPVASRLGMKLDADAMIYRPADRNSPAHAELARAIAQDATLRAAVRRSLGRSAQHIGATDLVDWFFGRPADIEALGRLARQGIR